MPGNGGDKAELDRGDPEEPTQVIALISEFDQSIAHLSFADVTRGALAFMGQRLGIERASVALLKEDEQGFLMFDSTLDISGLESGKAIPLDSASLGETVRRGASIYREDIRTWPVPNQVDSALLAAGLHCTFSVPLTCGGTCLGTLNAGAEAIDGLRRPVRQVIELLAPRLSFAIYAGLARDRTAESESRLRDIFATVGDGLIVADVSDRRLLMVNPAICEMLGRSEKELLGLTINSIHPKDRLDEVVTTFVAMVEGHIGHALDIPLLRVDGTVFLADVTARLSKFAGKQCVVGLFRDSTSRRQREQEQVQYQKLESIRTLAAGIAHDFNNLLTGIVGNMDLAESYLEKGTEPSELLLEAQRAAVRATALTRQLLTFAKGGAPLRRTTDIVALVRESVEFVCRGTNVQSQFQIRNRVVHVNGDEGQLAQAIQNVVRNAVEAMPTGGVVQVEISVRNSGQLVKGEEVRILVIDQGAGIDPSIKERVFLPFITTKAQGSGLGLAVSYSVFHSHGGRIECRSEVGKGTTFEIALPVTELAVSEERHATPAAHRRTVHVLVMDDQAVVRQVAGRMLKKAGYEPCLVANGDDAIVAYRDALDRGQRFDVVILDLTVCGGMGGREAAARLLEIDPTANLVVSSGYSEDGVMAEYVQHGFKAVLPKPYNALQMIAAVAQFLIA